MAVFGVMVWTVCWLGTTLLYAQMQHHAGQSARRAFHLPSGCETPDTLCNGGIPMLGSLAALVARGRREKRRDNSPVPFLRDS